MEKKSKIKSILSIIVISSVFCLSLIGFASCEFLEPDSPSGGSSGSGSSGGKTTCSPGYCYVGFNKCCPISSPYYSAGKCFKSHSDAVRNGYTTTYSCR